MEDSREDIVQKMKTYTTRLVVTGTDESGRSYVEVDGPAPGTRIQPKRPVALTDLWQMDAVPTNPSLDGGTKEGQPFVLPPPSGGLVFRVVQFDPITEQERASVDTREIFASMNAASALVENSVSPYMHRTLSVDFGIVIQGTITMLLDDGVVEVGPGDVIVQRATNHAWENRGTDSAVVAFVLIDAKVGNH